MVSGKLSREKDRALKVVSAAICKDKGYGILQVPGHVGNLSLFIFLSTLFPLRDLICMLCSTNGTAAL